MKDNILRVGNRFLNPAQVAMVDMTTTEPPGARVYIQGFPHVLELEGDEAEAVLDHLGYGKAAREKTAKEKLKAEQQAQHEAERAAKVHAHTHK